MKRKLGAHSVYWYKVYTEECVLCGKLDTWKERQYTVKPKDLQDHYHYEQTACSHHF